MLDEIVPMKIKGNAVPPHSCLKLFLHCFLTPAFNAILYRRQFLETANFEKENSHEKTTFSTSKMMEDDLG